MEYQGNESINDVEFIECFVRSPHQMVCCLKHYGKDGNCSNKFGFLVMNQGLDIFLGNVFDGKDLTTLERLKYDSAEAMVKDGWIVD